MPFAKSPTGAWIQTGKLYVLLTQSHCRIPILDAAQAVLRRRLVVCGAGGRRGRGGGDRARRGGGRRFGARRRVGQRQRAERRRRRDHDRPGPVEHCRLS